MSLQKVMTIRLSVDLADELEIVARVDGSPVSEVIRDAIASHIAARRADPEFQRRLRERIEADRNILRRLAAPVAALEDPVQGRAD